LQVLDAAGGEGKTAASEFVSKLLNAIQDYTKK
jgi:hypothetical protein